MVEIINLRIARKRKLRSKRAQEATENRIKFGTSSHHRTIDKTNISNADKRHSAHSLETGDTSNPNDKDDA